MTESELRRRAVDAINGWIGSARGDAKHLDILSIYNGHTPLAQGYRVRVSDAHCAATVSAAYIKAGIAAYTGTECSVPRFVEAARRRGCWIENDAYVPKPGDAMVYDWQDRGEGDNTGVPDHIGMVTRCENGVIYLTEGNINGGRVGTLTRRVNSWYIRGFIAPDYAAIAKALGGGGAGKELAKGSRVRVRPGAKTYGGGALAPWVYKQDFEVMEVRGERAVIGLRGAVTAAVQARDLMVV